jgi:peptide-methionine (S)-S-oxide reductase
MEQIILAGGCFWCLDSLFKQIKGIEGIVCGYSGGSLISPTYQQVCSGESGHAEVIKVTYDPKQLPLTNLLEIFFSIHNPTTLNRQGNDVGTQYRSAIFVTDAIQRNLAEDVISDLMIKNDWGAPFVTEISTLTTFYSAEDKHQDYFTHHPESLYCQITIGEKWQKLIKKHPKWLRDAGSVPF